MNSKRYCIGVTGHRTIHNKKLIISKVQEVIKDIRKTTNSNLNIISPLAEGADRLVAREILLEENFNRLNQLIVVLPMDIDDYLKDFKTLDSRNEFLDLLNKAVHIVNLHKENSRDDAYLEAGHYVVKKSDVMLVIWDGLPSRGKGGTADIVDHIREIKKPFYWINSQNGEISYED